MIRLPLGIQTFSQIINEKMVYIDKTMYIKPLVEGYKYAFLSRPRRFGKSLFVSTLSEYFRGNRDLFKGLAIDNLQPEVWEQYPVIKLDFSRLSSVNGTELSATLRNILAECGSEFGVEVKGDADIEFFSSLVMGVQKKTNQRVVIIIDEYDKPIIDRLGDTSIAAENRQVLRNFFSVVKSLDEYIKFMFVTGVSKFTKVSLFSGFNQITDITFNKKFAGICGYDQKELEQHFEQHIRNIVTETGTEKAVLLDELKKWYNGYSWDGSTKLYNPFSVLSFFDSGSFQNFWYNTGTPYFLVDLIKRERFDITATENMLAVEESLSSDDLDRLQLKSLLFQTGYLTIKKRIRQQYSDYFELGFPNHEVESSFSRYLFAEMTNTEADLTGIYAAEIKVALQREDYETFEKHLKYLFAKIPSNLFIPEERYFHSLFIMLASLVGIEIESEVNTNIGRIDGALILPDKIFIVEFKYDKTAASAIDQIVVKRYSEKYAAIGKKLIMIGINFTRENIDILIRK